MSDDIDEMSKDDLAALAELHGIEIDGRWSAARIREAVRAKLGGESEAADAVELVAPPEPAPEAPSPAGDYNLDGMISEWAERWAHRLVRAWAEFEGASFTVTVETAHGRTTATIENVDDNAASVMAALDAARREMTGE